jgi:mannose-6-phosphate isomerase-like protein (cupin superfamily)
MELLQVDPPSGFRILTGTSRSQAATLLLVPVVSTGGPNNRHARSDQWLYVVSGSGKAILEGTEHELEAGSLLLIEAGEAHEISNASEQPLKTLSVYAPPEY